MIKRVFEMQNRNRTPKYWITTVLKDLEELESNFTFKEKKRLSKEGWKSMVNQVLKIKHFKL